jgi:hypothetical protein
MKNMTKILIGGAIATSLIGGLYFVQEKKISTAENLIKKAIKENKNIKKIGEVKCKAPTIFSGINSLVCEIKDIDILLDSSNNGKVKIKTAILTNPIAAYKNKEIIEGKKGYKPGYKDKTSLVLKDIRIDNKSLNEIMISAAEKKIDNDYGVKGESFKKKVIKSFKGKTDLIVKEETIIKNDKSLKTITSIDLKIGKTSIKGSMDIEINKASRFMDIPENIIESEKRRLEYKKAKGVVLKEFSINYESEKKDLIKELAEEIIKLQGVNETDIVIKEVLNKLKEDKNLETKYGKEKSDKIKKKIEELMTGKNSSIGIIIQNEKEDINLMLKKISAAFIYKDIKMITESYKIDLK